MNKLIFLLFLFLLFAGFDLPRHNNDNAIIGNWMSTDKNLEVEVFKMGNEFKARVIWFDDGDNKGEPMNARLDSKNSNKALRSRKIIGLEVMHGLEYNSDDNEWQNGWIYDSSSGKIWSAKASLTEDGRLKVRGFWHFQFLGQNIYFKRVS